MASGPAAQPVYVVSRERLAFTLAFPFALLYAASLIAWPWRALDLPGVFGTLTPPSIFLLAATVAASMYAMRRKLPMGMLTWLPAGQGAVMLLGIGFLPPGVDENTALVVTIIVVGIVYLLALGLGVAIATHGTHLAIAFVAFFVMTQASRFPIFEVHATAPLTAAPLFTLAAALRSALELGLLVWLASRLVTSEPAEARRAAWLIVGLTLAHGIIAGWEDPVLRGELSFGQVIEQAGRWLIPTTVQLGMITVLARLRNSWLREPPATPESASTEALSEVEMEEQHGQPLEQPEEEPAPFAAPRRGGRPTPRKRRRR